MFLSIPMDGFLQKCLAAAEFISFISVQRLLDGGIECYDRTYDRITLKYSLTLERFKKTRFKVVTTKEVKVWCSVDEVSDRVPQST